MARKSDFILEIIPMYNPQRTKPLILQRKKLEMVEHAISLFQKQSILSIHNLNQLVKSISIKIVFFFFGR
jgi:hypothetical protein